jgi:hypothetical protein
MAKVSHIVLPVSDVPRSREWYVNTLGFTLERELDQAVGIKDESGLTIFLVKATDPLAGQRITLTVRIARRVLTCGARADSKREQRGRNGCHDRRADAPTNCEPEIAQGQLLSDRILGRSAPRHQPKITPVSRVVFLSKPCAGITRSARCRRDPCTGREIHSRDWVCCVGQGSPSHVAAGAPLNIALSCAARSSSPTRSAARNACW